MASVALIDSDQAWSTASGPSVFFHPCPRWVDCRVVGISTAETFSPPTGARYVEFGAEANFWARFDGQAAAIAGADVTDGSSAFLNPVKISLASVSSISVISATAQKITLSYYGGD